LIAGLLSAPDHNSGAAVPFSANSFDLVKSGTAPRQPAGDDALTLHLTNTLTRKKEAFRPIDPENIRMYVCGPTVYDFAHIGNARPIIVFDVLYRLLRHLYGEEHVTYVRNITDVDDKINARAAEEGVSIADVTSRTIKQFHADIAALGVLPPTVEPRATKHIDEMKHMIAALIDGGHAYAAEGHVLFDVSSDADYGCLSHRNVDEMQAGARVEVASYKKNPMDFVLWKPSSGAEPGWDSPWGFGRPGWHIECSAMSEKYLDKTFDIHGGGADLVFPHHENEIAQSTCAHDNAAMANYWVHNGYLQVEGEKMSKSLGNFITIHDLLETEKFGGQKWPGFALRFAMLSTHYRQPIDWTEKGLTTALAVTDDFFWAAAQTDLANPSSGIVLALEDDLNTHKAIKELHDIRKRIRHSGEGDAAFELAQNLNFLGLNKKEHSKWHDQETQRVSKDVGNIEALIANRNTARAAKNWAEADRIRDELADQGIILKDGPEGTTWEIKR
jgi:cysteinyl-tRNA synthetase